MSLNCRYLAIISRLQYFSQYDVIVKSILWKAKKYGCKEVKEREVLSL